jgi:hypothetical protein
MDVLIGVHLAKLLRWRLHFIPTCLGAALALASIAGGILAFRLPAVWPIAAVNGVLGAGILFKGVRRLPPGLRLVGGVLGGLLLAALPYLAAQFGLSLIVGLVFAGLLARLKTKHVAIALCLLAGCVWAGLVLLFGSVAAGANPQRLNNWSIAAALAGFAVNLFVFILRPNLSRRFPGLSLKEQLRAWWRSRPGTRELIKNRPALALCWLAFVVAATCSVWPVLRHSGWPFNHEQTQPMLRVMVYLRHWAQNDFLPLWSGTDCWTMGSPEPFYYHKLFYWVYAFVAKMTGAVKGGLVLTIIFFLIVGASGIFYAALKLGLRKPEAAMLGITLAFANYTYTDWLIRGAVAEFSGAMIIPWLLYWCICLLQNEFSWKQFIWLGILMTVLGHAHNAAAMICAAIVGWAFILQLVGRIREAPKLVAGGACALGLFLLLAAPFIWVAVQLDPYYDMSRQAYNYIPYNQFRDFKLYFWDPTWHWGQNWEWNPVQLDLFVLSGIAAAGLCLVGLGLWRLLRGFGSGGRDFGGHDPDSCGIESCPPKSRPPKSPYTNIFIWLFLVGVSALMLFMQTRNSAAIWGAESLHYLLYLQFPWRLLAIITPALILLLAGLLAAVRHKYLQMVLAATVMIGTMAISAAPQPINYKDKWFSAEEVEATQATQSQSFLSENVYFPVVGRKVDAQRYYEYATSNDYEHMAANYGSKDCKITREPLDNETLHSEWRVEMRAGGPCVLPLAFTPLATIYAKNGDEKFRELPAYCTETDPRIHVELKPGNYHVWVRNPSFPALLGFYAPPE